MENQMLLKLIKHLSLATVVALPMMAGGASIASAGECTASYNPDYVRMRDGGVHRNNWRHNNFLRLNSWAEVPARFGVPVEHAQGRTCGCTNYAGNPPVHRNPTCQRALDAGLR